MGSSQSDWQDIEKGVSKLRKKFDKFNKDVQVFSDKVDALVEDTEKREFTRCRFWDCGWCFMPNSPHNAGCVGASKCEVPEGDRR